MITTLSAEECRALLTAATVGRVGFVRAGRVEIIPVNYLRDGDDLIIRTAPDGILSELAASPVELAFEVDHIHPQGGTGWSVLLSGTARAVSDPDELAALRELPWYSTTPWAGGDRSLHLRFTPSTISGREVRHERRA